jgi:hypothetical protein
MTIGPRYQHYAQGPMSTASVNTLSPWGAAFGDDRCTRCGVGDDDAASVSARELSYSAEARAAHTRTEVSEVQHAINTSPYGRSAVSIPASPGLAAHGAPAEWVSTIRGPRPTRA